MVSTAESMLPFQWRLLHWTQDWSWNWTHSYTVNTTHGNEASESPAMIHSEIKNQIVMRKNVRKVQCMIYVLNKHFGNISLEIQPKLSEQWSSYQRVLMWCPRKDVSLYHSIMSVCCWWQTALTACLAVGNNIRDQEQFLWGFYLPCFQTNFSVILFFTKTFSAYLTSAST